MKKRFIILAILFCPLFLYFPSLSLYPFPLHSSYSDLLISHLPNAIYLQRAILSFKEIPLWSDLIMGGYPFFADPLSGLWYPPEWLLLIYPHAPGFNILILLHVLWGGAGMLLFLRSQQFNEFASLSGALFFELFPKTMAHSAAGHVTLVFAFAWIPWLLLFEYRRGKYYKFDYFFPAIIFSLIILADIRLAAYIGLLWCVYSLRNHFQQKSNFIKEKIIPELGKWTMKFASQVMISLALASPFLFPFIQFTGLSTRGMLTTAENLFLSMKPLLYLGLIFPDIGRYAEWVIYPGMFALFAILWIVHSKDSIKQNLFWMVLFLVCIIYALGEQFPFVTAISSLPGLNLLRVPTRVIFLTSVPLAIFVSTACSQFNSSISKFTSEKLYVSNILVIIFTGFIFIFSIGIWLVNKTISFNFVWGAIITGLVCLAYFLRTRNLISGNIWTFITLPLIVLDLSVVNIAGIQFKPESDVFNFPSGIMEILKGEDQPFRIYSPSYSLPQQIGAVNDLEHSDGINPLQLSGYVEFMQGATGVPFDGYSVTLPPFQTGNPQSDNVQFIPDAKELGLENVKYVISAFPISSEGLVRITGFDSPYLYFNQDYLPRAWVQESSTKPGVGIMSTAQIIKKTPNHLSLNAVGPGTLVISENNYPGWIATVNGRQSEITSIDNLFISIPLSNGPHQINLVFRPTIQYYGFAFCIFATIFLIIHQFMAYKVNS